MRWLVTAGLTVIIILHCLFSVASHPKHGALLSIVELSETRVDTPIYSHKCPKLQCLVKYSLHNDLHKYEVE